MKKIEFIAQKNQSVTSAIISQIDGVSFNVANALLRKKDVIINGVRTNKNIDVCAGDNVTIFIAENQISSVKFYEIIYQDANVLIVSKRQGIEVSSPNASAKTLQTEIEQTEKFPVFTLHRIDRNTSGLVIFAKSKRMLEKLKSAMKKGEIRKFYKANIFGYFNETQQEFTAYLVKNETESRVKIYDKSVKGSEQISMHVTTVKVSGGTSEVIVEISNGKTHQIRAHLAHLGHAIIGDLKYGKREDNKKYNARFQQLEAYKLIFNFTDPELSYLNEKNITTR